MTLGLSAQPETQHVLEYGARTVAIAEGREVVAGRSKAATFVLDVATVSRFHARFSAARGRVYVEDLGSRNGVWVNGTKIQGTVELADGDQILVGNQLLTYRTTIVEPVSTAPPPSAPRPPTTAAPAGEDITRPMSISARVQLDQATQALEAGRHVEARTTLDGFLLAMEREIAEGRLDRDCLVQGTIALLLLTEATRDAAPLELLLRLRRIAGEPLDPKTTEEVARSIESLPRTRDEQRRAYCRWLRSQPATFTARLALQRLEKLR